MNRGLYACAAASLALLVAGGTSAAQPAHPSMPESAQAEPIHLAVGANLGAAYRADDPPAFVPVQRGGLTFGARMQAWVRAWLAVGLAYEHTDLGHEQSGVGESGVVDVTRDLSSLWATLQVAPLVSDGVAAYLVFGPGFSWQSADANGLVFTRPFASAPVAIGCEGSDSFDLALRGGAGIEGRLGTPGLVLFVEATMDVHRLSSEPMSGCVVGAGTATLLGARAGAAYRFDVTRFVR